MTALPPTLTTERLTLRQFELRDMEPYIAYLASPRTAGVGGPKPRFQAIERFMAMAGQWALRGYGRYAISAGGTAFGHVGILHAEDTAPVELTWTLWDETREGMGFATEAARAVRAAWTGAPLRVHVMPGNTRSLAVAERLGFIHDASVPGPDYAPELMSFRDAQEAVA